MNRQLYEIVRRSLAAQLADGEPLEQVIMSGLEERIDESQDDEARQYLRDLLRALRERLEDAPETRDEPAPEGGICTCGALKGNVGHAPYCPRFGMDDQRLL